jgi:hypothetical protein
MQKKMWTALIVLALLVLIAALLAWHPWYAPRPYVPLDPWTRIIYSTEEQQNAQQQAKSTRHPELLDPEQMLRSFLGTGIQDNPRVQFDMEQVRSLEDCGTDLRTGDRMFCVTLSTKNTVVLFRLRQLQGRGPGNTWFVVGYLPDPAGAGYGS